MDTWAETAKDRLRPWRWFVGLYAADVGSLAALAYVLRGLFETLR